MYSNFALLIPTLTQWSSNNTATIIGSVGEHGRIIKIGVPATEASVKE